MKSGCHLILIALPLAAWPTLSYADPATPGYPERVLQWTVQEAETCADISNALYGSPTHLDLIERYNPIRCASNKPLPKGATLVVPEKVTVLAPANLRSLAPAVRARPAGGAWQPATPGMPLHRNDNVNTLEDARADIRFVDRTRVVLAEHTLVVIYGTAAETRVSRTAPAAVQLDEGEVEAGLAALGGRPVGVAVQGGGQVDAQSTDTVVRKKSKRTTVSVYDGKAAVKSGGSTVQVPERFGSSFEEAKAPTPPRPLPPAPAWTAETTGGVVIAMQGKARLTAAWAAVDKAVAYRVELAHDPAFHDLIAREEVLAEVRSFRGEELPPGEYHLRVRAIDNEDYMGLTTPPLSFVLLGVRPAGGAVPPEGALWRVNPYATLTFDPRPDVALSIDGGPFGPVPAGLDLSESAPKRLSFRMRDGGQQRTYDLQYEDVKADVRVRPSPLPNTVGLSIHLTAVESVDISARIAPRLRLSMDGRLTELPLAFTGTDATAEFPAPASHNELVAYVIDRRGRLLGNLVIPPAAETTSGADAAAEPVLVGITAPVVPLSPAVDAVWWTPSPWSNGLVSGGAAVTSDGTGGQLRAAGTASFGRATVDAQLASNAMGNHINPDSAGWFGGRLELGSNQHGNLSWGPALRLAVPMSSNGPQTRAELGLAVGALRHRFGWLANVGARMRLESSDPRAPTPSSQAFLLGGATYDVQPALRLWSCLDTHLIHDDARTAGRAGLAAGVEVGRSWFGSLGVRASPWDDAGGWLSAQLALGARTW